MKLGMNKVKGKRARGFRYNCQAAFTVIELLISVAILSIVFSIAVPLYQGYIEEGRISVAVQDLRNISFILDDALSSGGLPDSLTEVGINYDDPWGNPYQYLNLQDPSVNKGQVRKDKNLVPINSDYDLYSMGPDGDSKGPLTAKASRDDIVRANDGAFFGEAQYY